MAEILTNNKNYYDIANTIRQMKNVNTTYKPREMASALKDIYSNEAEGTLPLSFEANGNNLLNYRIDGASGGVGDRTSNLFDYKTWKNGITGISNSGNIIFNNDNSFTITANNVNDVFTLGYSNYKVLVKAETDYYFNFSSNNTNTGLIYIFENGTNDNEHKHIAFNQTEKYVSFTTQPDTTYIIIRFGVYVANTEITYKNISLVEGNSAPSNYEPYGYKVPVKVEGKNLIKNTAESTTVNGITFNINDDFSVTIQGSLTSTRADLTLSPINDIILDAGSYIGSCKNAVENCYFIFGGSVSTSGIRAQNVTDSSERTVSTNTGGGLGYCIIRVTASIPEPITLYPMIRRAEIADGTYEPYIEPTTTNIYLDEPIYANESISLSDTNTNIPTIDGTNVLTINTTVQPSNVYIQAPKDSIEAIQIANRLEEI